MSVNHFNPEQATDTVAVYLHGFASTQSGEKALYLGERLARAGVAYTTFDFRGHGSSGGTMRDLTLTGLLEDCAQVIEPLESCYSSIVLIGSSMGGMAAAWYSALNPGRVAANVLLAPAFNFVELLMDQFGPEGVREWERRGVMEFQNEYSSGELDYNLVRDWANYPLSELISRYATPTLIIHGLRDESISYRRSLDFIERARFPGIDLILVKDGDHRLTAQKERLGDWIVGYLRSVISHQYSI